MPGSSSIVVVVVVVVVVVSIIAVFAATASISAEQRLACRRVQPRRHSLLLDGHLDAHRRAGALLRAEMTKNPYLGGPNFEACPSEDLA